MKVLMLGNDPTVKGGISSVIKQLMSDGWGGNDIDARFISTYKGKNAVAKIYHFSKAYIRIIFSLLVFKPDLVHVHMSYKGSFTRTYYVQKLCKLFNKKTIIHLHGSEFKKWYCSCIAKKQRKIQTFFKTCNHVIVLGKKMKETILEIQPASKVSIINNATPRPNKRTCYDEDRINLLFLGVLIKRKGLRDLLEAFASIDNQRLFLRIAGTGKEERKLKKWVKDNNLSGNIEFLGWIDQEEKDRVIKKTQWLVLPSYNEGLPMCIIEAMSYGIPIIATNIGDIKEAVDDRYNGYVFNPGNVRELARILSEVSNLDKNEWTQLSDNSYLKWKQSFSVDAFYRKIYAVYKELATESSENRGVKCF